MNRSIDNLRFRPLQHPEFYEYYKLAKLNPWTVFELDFFKDKQDWINHMDDGEKAAFTRGLTNFTLTENVIGEYWSEVPAREYDVPEIVMMAREFASQESNHLIAYNQIEENFDLDTFEQFKADEDARKKVENLLDLRSSDLYTSLAVFSGAVEGCSLFSIFALFTLFCRNNKMKTVKEILGWSAIDEELHSTAGIALFNKFCPAQRNDDMKNRIISGFDAVIANEEDFIDYVLPEDLPIASAIDLKNYFPFTSVNIILSISFARDVSSRYP